MCIYNILYMCYIIYYIYICGSHDASWFLMSHGSRLSIDAFQVLLWPSYGVHALPPRVKESRSAWKGIQCIPNAFKVYSHIIFFYSKSAGNSGNQHHISKLCYSCVNLHPIVSLNISLKHSKLNFIQFPARFLPSKTGCAEWPSPRRSAWHNGRRKQRLPTRVNSIENKSKLISNTLSTCVYIYREREREGERERVYICL